MLQCSCMGVWSCTYASYQGEEPFAYSTWVFLHVTRLCLGTLLPPYCSGESVPAAGVIIPLLVYVCV